MRKIKRTSSIYTRRHGRPRSSPLVAILFVLGAALLIFIGWSIAGPIQDYLSGNLKTAKSSSSKPKSSSGAPAKSSSSSKTSSAATTANNGIKGIYLPKNYLTDSSALDGVISAAKNAGINFAVLDLKTEDGYLNYASQIADASANGLIAPNAPDAAAVATKLKNAGITPCARICAFQDPLASSKMRDAAVHYSLNHSYLWLDVSRNSWLNPYSDQAQSYIVSVAKEAVSLGYKNVMLDGVTFPPTGSSAWFGDSSVSKEDTLKAFVASATQQINAAGGKVLLHTTGLSTIGAAPQQSGQNQSLYGFTADYFSPDFDPSALGSQTVQIGASSVTKPDLTPAQTVQQLAQYLTGNASDKSKVSATVPYIQAFTNTGLGAGSYKTYTADDINAEIASLKSAGITSYILYSPSGSYSFTGLSVK